MERSTLWSGLMLLIVSLTQLRFAFANDKCEILHPQELSRQSQFVAEITVTNQYQTTKYGVDYDVEVHEIFKATPQTRKLLNKNIVTITTDGSDQLESGKSFVIGGVIKNNKLHTMSCGLLMSSLDVIDYQRNGFRKNYNTKCQVETVGLGGLLSDPNKCAWDESSSEGDCYKRFSTCSEYRKGECSWTYSLDFDPCIMEIQSEQK